MSDGHGNGFPVYRDASFPGPRSSREGGDSFLFHINKNYKTSYKKGTYARQEIRRV